MPGLLKPLGVRFASHKNKNPIFSGAVLVVEPENFLNRVLLVADNPTAGAVIREQLSGAGYDVHWAKSRMEAGMLWQPSYYDVVLLDLRRDPDRGEDLARRIKATDPAQRILFLNGRNGSKEAA